MLYRRNTMIYSHKNCDKLSRNNSQFRNISRDAILGNWFRQSKKEGTQKTCAEKESWIFFSQVLFYTRKLNGGSTLKRVYENLAIDLYHLQNKSNFIRFSYCYSSAAEYLVTAGNRFEFKVGASIFHLPHRISGILFGRDVREFLTFHSTFFFRPQRN